MNEILEALKNPGAMTSQQWLLILIMLFVIVGSAYFVFRLYRIIDQDRKSSYVPNIGRKRLQMEAEQRNSASGRDV